MDFSALQEWRAKRMKELSDHPDFGSIAALGRALGSESGAHVSQMIHGRRPITEKTIAQVDRLGGGKFAGWFDQGQADKADPFTSALSLAAIELGRAFDELQPEQRRAVYPALLRAIHAAGTVSPTAHAPRPAAPPRHEPEPDPRTRLGKRHVRP